MKTVHGMAVTHRIVIGMTIADMTIIGATIIGATIMIIGIMIIDKLIALAIIGRVEGIDPTAGMTTVLANPAMTPISTSMSTGMANG